MDFVQKMDRFGREITANKLTDDEGFLVLARDFETLTGTQNLYVSVSMLRQLAARNPELRLVSAAALEHRTAERDRLQAELDQVKAERDELRAKLDRVNGIAKDGFKVVRQTGRPAKAKVGV